MIDTILETIIGLVFVYLLLSMICSALQEWIATLFAWRSKTLFEGVSKMVCGDANLLREIYSHPLIDGLSRKSWLDRRLNREARPSYIAPQTFAKAFLAAANVTPQSLANNNFAQARNGQPLQQNMQKLLTSLSETTPGNIDALRESVAQWYADAMDRVSGWYKRKTHLVLLIIGLAVAIAFNADTLMLARAFWTDPVLRAETNAAAQQWIQTHPNGPAVAASTATPQPQQSPAPATTAQTGPEIADNYPSTTLPGEAAPPAVEQPYSPEQIAQAQQEYREASARLQATSQETAVTLASLKVPLGWCSAPPATSGNEDEEKSVDPTTTNDIEPVGEETPAQVADPTRGESLSFTNSAEQSGSPWSLTKAGAVCDPDHQFPRAVSPLVLKFLGLLITMLAISQGAPFWFDLLKKIVNLRLAGDAPNEK